MNTPTASNKTTSTNKQSATQTTLFLSFVGRLNAVCRSSVASCSDFSWIVELLVDCSVAGFWLLHCFEALTNSITLQLGSPLMQRTYRPWSDWAHPSMERERSSFSFTVLFVKVFPVLSPWLFQITFSPELFFQSAITLSLVRLLDSRQDSLMWSPSHFTVCLLFAVLMGISRMMSEMPNILQVKMWIFKCTY